MRTIGTVTLDNGRILCRRSWGAEFEMPMTFSPADLTDESRCAELLRFVKLCWHPDVRLRGRQVGALTVFDVVEHPASIEAAVRELVEAVP